MDVKTEARIRFIVRAMHESGAVTSSHPLPTDTEVITALNRAERGEMPDIMMQSFISMMLDMALEVDAPITLKAAHTVAQTYRRNPSTMRMARPDEVSPRWLTAIEQHKLASLAKASGCILFPLSNGKMIVLDTIRGEPAGECMFDDPEDLRRFLLSRTAG